MYYGKMPSARKELNGELRKIIIDSRLFIMTLKGMGIKVT